MKQLRKPPKWIRILQETSQGGLVFATKLS
uniref:Uncharacterized protein n=1 Tax=Rhizophora mucronata TaxID=61149 RepID=A0A2P2NC42_RHIMU